MSTNRYEQGNSWKLQYSKTLKGLFELCSQFNKTNIRFCTDVGFLQTIEIRSTNNDAY